MRGCPVNTGEAESGKNGTVIPKEIRQVFSIAHAVLQSEEAGMITNQWTNQIGQSGISGCFGREDDPVAYYSRKLNKAQQNYTTIEKELY